MYVTAQINFICSGAGSSDAHVQFSCAQESGRAWNTKVHSKTDPSSSLVSFDKVRVSDVDSSLLFPCLVQVMLGFGFPVALQNRINPLPSTT